jgi:peptidyl-prolyl cis-trans isomerase C
MNVVMKRILKLVVLLLAAGSLGTRGRAADAPSAEGAKPVIKVSDLFPDAVVAKGRGVEIKRSQLDDTVGSIKATYAARGQALPPEQIAMLEQQVLERLIQIQLLLAKATDADKAKGKEVCAKRIAEIKTRAGSEEALNRQLKSVGTSQEELRTKMGEESTAETVLERELKVQVKDEDIKKYYDDNPSRFEQPEMVRASHVLLSTRDPETNKELSDDKKAAKHKLAEDVMKRARAGEDFAKLAKEYSEDPGSKDKGGEYTFPRKKMVPEFESAAFALKPNEVSDIVTTQFGYHVIKLSEKIPAKVAKLDDDVIWMPGGYPADPGYVVIKSYWHAPVETNWPSGKLSDLIRQNLEGQERQKEMPGYLAKLKKEANVEILDDSLKRKETDTATAPPGRPSPEPKAKPSK